MSLAAAVALFAAFHYMRAQGETSLNAVKAPKALAVPETTGPNVPHVLFWTFFTQGLNVGKIIPAGEGSVDSPTTFKCVLPCTLEIEQSIQVNSAGYPNNLWVAEVYVDGSYVPYSPYIGYVPSDGSVVMGNVNQSLSLKPGTHTVQSFVNSSAGLYLEDYHISYRVYLP